MVPIAEAFHGRGTTPGQGHAVKIAYLVNTYPLSSSTFVRRELQAVERAGVDVSRFALRMGSPLTDEADIAEQGRTEYILAQPWWRLIATALATLANSPRQAMLAIALTLRLARRSRTGYMRHVAYLVEACDFARRCRELGIQHVHAHFGTNSAAIAMLAGVLGGPTYSFTVHGPEEFDMPQSLSLDEKVARAAFVVAISSFGRSQLFRWSRSADWSRIKVVHCGFDPSLFLNASAPAGRRRLVTVGRFVEQKGQVLLIEAMAHACRKFPDLHLTMIGDGAMRGDIEAAIRAAKLEGNVTIAGWLDEKAVAQALADADALVLPSFAEGLPVVLMEAMAAARPVIATRIAGVPELVAEGVHGWLVTAGDLESLTDALERFAATAPDKLAAMGRAGRARALQRHDIDACAARLIEHVASVTGDVPIRDGSMVSPVPSRPAGARTALDAPVAARRPAAGEGASYPPVKVQRR